MTEIWLRKAEEIDGAKVGEAPLTREGIAEAFALVSSWGVLDEGYDLVGQFRIDETHAYFEIVVIHE